MGVPARYGTSFVSDERRYRSFTVTEIGGKADEAMPQDVRRHVGGNSAEPCDSGPEFFSDAGGVGATARCREDPIVVPLGKAAQYAASHVRQRAHTTPRLAVAERSRAAYQVDFRPLQCDGFAAPPSSEHEKACSSDGGRPDALCFSLAQRGTEGGVFAVAEPPLARSIRKPLNPMSRVVGAHAAPNAIAENPAEQAHRSGSGCLATGYSREPPLSSRLCPNGRFSLGDIVHEPINVIARDRGHRKRA